MRKQARRFNPPLKMKARLCRGGKNHYAIFKLSKPLIVKKGESLSFVLDFKHNTKFGIGRFKISLLGKVKTGK